MNEKTLICMMGLPRSGKSTTAAKLSEALKAPIVNPDAIRLSLHGQPFLRTAEKFVWAVADLMVKSLFEAYHDIVILDATNTTRVRRDCWASSDWDVRFCEIPESPQTCISRAEAEGRRELIPVIEQMWEKYEPLGEDETPFLS